MSISISDRWTLAARCATLRAMSLVIVAALVLASIGSLHGTAYAAAPRDASGAPAQSAGVLSSHAADAATLEAGSPKTADGGTARTVGFALLAFGLLAAACALISLLGAPPAQRRRANSSFAAAETR